MSITHSVVLPQRGAADAVARRANEWCAVLDELAVPYEIIIVDDHSTGSELSRLTNLLEDCPALRLLRLDRPCGPAAAVSAGVAAARGKIVVAWDAGGRVSPRYLRRLLDRLTRHDFVAARTEKSRFWRLMARLWVLPRRLLLGAPTLDPDGPCWVARAEAVADLGLSPGQHRYLPWIVSMSGFRVGGATVPETPAADHTDRAARRKLARWSNESGGWFDLLALWWKRVRAQEYCVDEIQPTGDPLLGVGLRARRMVRFDSAHPAAATTESTQKSHYDDPPRS